MFRRTLFAVVVVTALLAGSAYAGSRWIITSTRQIKPSVLTQLRTLKTIRVLGSVSTSYPSGNGDNGSTADCPRGTVIVGGGWDPGPVPGGDMSVFNNEPQGNGWYVDMTDLGPQPATYEAVALCARP